jgi:hypothetical protein
MSSFGPANSISSYLPIEFDISDDFKKLQEDIAERERLTASIVNIKENANYERVELLSGQQWYSTQSVSVINIPRYGYRVVADLVALNGGNIGAGTTNLVLTTTTTPVLISGSTIPLPSHGSATSVSGVYLFLNDPQVFVRFTPATQTISITNNFGSDLTQCYWVMEYLKQ